MSIWIAAVRIAGFKPKRRALLSISIVRKILSSDRILRWIAIVVENWGGNGSGLVGTGKLCAWIAAVRTVDPLKTVAGRLKPNWNVERSSSSCLKSAVHLLVQELALQVT